MFTLIADGVVNWFPTRFFRQEYYFQNNVAYKTYRITFPTVLDAANANSMQIAEVELLGNVVQVPVTGPKIAWVSFHPADATPGTDAATAGFTKASDVVYTDMLKANNYQVTRIVTSGTPDTALLNTFDLVVISRSVPSGDYQDPPETLAWNGIKAPTMILGGYIIRNNRLGFMTGANIPDTTNSVKLAVKVPTHPIFAGISLDANNTMVNNYANIATYTNTIQRGISVVTDAAAGGGTVLATVGSPDPAFGGMVIGEWQAGAAMATAAADKLGGRRLVFLTGSREASGLTSQGAGIYDLTEDGGKMFLNAVKYMTTSTPTPVTPTLSLTRSATGVTITFTGTLQSADSLNGQLRFANVY